MKNETILSKSSYDLKNIVYVWKETGLLKEDSTLHRGKLQCENYLRIYLRYKYLNSGINYLKSPISYHALTVSEKRFKTEYSGSLNGAIFFPGYEELVNFCGVGNTFKEKEEYIKKIVSAYALRWLSNCLRSEREKKNGKSI